MKLILCFFMLLVESLFYIAAIKYFGEKYQLLQAGNGDKLRNNPKDNLRGILTGKVDWNACSTYIVLAFPIILGAWLWRERLLYGTGILSFTAYLCFILIAWIDYESMRIPNELCAVLLLLGLLAILWNVTTIGFDSLGFHSLAAVKLWEHLLGFFVISVPFLMINVVYAGAFGAGDVKLMAAAGFYLGYKATVKATLVGSFVAAVFFVGLILLRRIRLKDKMAFGPYLCIGLIYVLLQ